MNAFDRAFQNWLNKLESQMRAWAARLNSETFYVSVRNQQRIQPGAWVQASNPLNVLFGMHRMNDIMNRLTGNLSATGADYYQLAVQKGSVSKAQQIILDRQDMEQIYNNAREIIMRLMREHFTEE